MTIQDWLDKELSKLDTTSGITSYWKGGYVDVNVKVAILEGTSTVLFVGAPNSTARTRLHIKAPRPDHHDPIYAGYYLGGEYMYPNNGQKMYVIDLKARKVYSVALKAVKTQIGGSRTTSTTEEGPRAREHIEV